MSTTYWKPGFTSRVNEPRDRIDATFRTTIPSISLKTLNATTVECDFAGTKTVKAIFRSGTSTLDIRASVPSNAPEFMILIDGEHNCNPDKPGFAAWILATGITVNSDDSITFTNASVTKASNYLSYYKFVLDSSPMSQSAEAQEPLNLTDLKRRGASEFTVTFGPTKLDAPPISLGNGVEVSCRGCQTKSTFKLNVEIEANAFKKKPNVKMSLQGNTDVGIGLHFAIKTSAKAFSFPRVPLFTVPISPFDIPGIISFGPQFGVFMDTNIKVGAKGEFDVGFDLNTGGTLFKVDVQATEEAPKDGKGSQNDFNPTLKFRPIAAKVEGSVSGDVKVVPEFSVGIEILEKQIVGLGIRLNNDLTTSLSTEIGLTGQSACPLKADIHGSSSLEGFVGSFFTKNLATFVDKDVFSACVIS
ncbi:hypothetical protein HK098_001189 [Nowakowskiella sp. JEL0407]|nr:hypothetical protein HK098_001189 [Nowakowskiella sp. JEL0407]